GHGTGDSEEWIQFARWNWTLPACLIEIACMTTAVGGIERSDDVFPVGQHLAARAACGLTGRTHRVGDSFQKLAVLHIAEVIPDMALAACRQQIRTSGDGLRASCFHGKTFSALGINNSGDGGFEIHFDERNQPPRVWLNFQASKIFPLRMARNGEP